MSDRSNRLVWVLLWLATAIATGLVVGWTLRTPTSGVPGEPLESSDSRRSLLQGDAPAAPLRPGPTPTPALKEADQPSDASEGDAKTPSLFAQRGWIKVEVDGRPTNATAYALPQQANGTNKPSEVSVALVHRGQRLTIPVPGLYDVGVRFPDAAPVILRDVTVRSGETTTVRATPPVPGHVTFSLAGKALPPQLEIALWLEPNYDQVVQFPGRGERPLMPLKQARIAGDMDVPVAHGTMYAVRAWLAVAASVPRDQQGALRPTGEFGVVLSSARVRSGDQVTATITRQCGLHVEISGRTKESPGLLLHLERGTKHIAQTAIGAGFVPTRVTLWAQPGTATLVWRGANWKSGSMTVQLVAARDVTVRIDPTQAEPEAPSKNSAQLTRFETITTASLPDDAKLQLAFLRKGNKGHSLMQRYEVHGATLEIDSENLETEWVWLARDDYLAERVRVQPGRTQRVTLRAGGYLAVVYAGPLPGEFEADGLALRRRDRSLFWCRQSPTDANPEPSMRVAFRNGMVLGPLPTGPQTFELLSGAVSNGFVTAHVKPGEVVPLVVR